MTWSHGSKTNKEDHAFWLSFPTPLFANFFQSLPATQIERRLREKKGDSHYRCLLMGGQGNRVKADSKN